MEIENLSVSVVVLAQDHNPTILHPSFLTSQGIVPNEWELAELPLCTPPLSVVKYKNGITFTVESNKFQVIESPPQQRLHDSNIPKLSIDYIEVLPHVRYKAVGINIGAILKNPDPEKYLIERYLTSGSWNAEDFPLKAFAFRFVYEVEGGGLNLSCDPGKARIKGTEKDISGIIVNANYNYNLTGSDVLNEAKTAISTYTDRCNHFDQVINQVFRMEK